MPPSVKKVFQFQSPSWAFTALGCDCSVTILPPQRSVPGVNWGSFNQSALRPNPLARLAFIRRRVVTLRLFVRVSVWTKRPLFLYLFRLRFFYDITFVRAPVKNISTSQGGKKKFFFLQYTKKKGATTLLQTIGHYDVDAAILDQRVFSVRFSPSLVLSAREKSTTSGMQNNSFIFIVAELEWQMLLILFSRSLFSSSTTNSTTRVFFFFFSLYFSPVLFYTRKQITPRSAAVHPIK